MPLRLPGHHSRGAGEPLHSRKRDAHPPRNTSRINLNRLSLVSLCNRPAVVGMRGRSQGTTVDLSFFLESTKACRLLRRVLTSTSTHLTTITLSLQQYSPFADDGLRPAFPPGVQEFAQSGTEVGLSGLCRAANCPLDPHRVSHHSPTSEGARKDSL